MAETVSLVVGLLQGIISSSLFVLVLMIGFCVVIGVLKLKKTIGGDLVVKSIDERMDHKAVVYLSPKAPHGPADQLRAPELLESKT